MIATPDDLPRLIEMAGKFAAWADLDANMSAVGDVLEQAITRDDCLVEIQEHGFIAGGIAPAWFNPSLRVAEELMWWSEDGKGLRLLDRFEEWAIENRADWIVMIHLPKNGRRVERLYRRRGYELSDSKYVRAL